jgi:hypothetical protein
LFAQRTSKVDWLTGHNDHERKTLTSPLLQSRPVRLGSGWSSVETGSARNDDGGGSGRARLLSL